MTFHDQLVRSAYQFYVILAIELFYNISSKEVACSSWTHWPSSDFIWITPHKITHSSIMRHFLLPVNSSYFIKSLNAGTETSMHTEYFLVNDGWQSDVIEDLGAIPPDVYWAVLPQTLVIKAIDLSNLPALVVSPDQSDSLWIPHLQSRYTF